MTVATSTRWKEASKSSPCPLCDRLDWCYLNEDLTAVVCGRTHASDPPQGWRYVKDSTDQRPIFAVIEDKPPQKALPRTPKVIRRGTDKGVKLAKLPEIPQNVPLPQNLPIPVWLQNKGVPLTATTTTYRYSENQWVNRYDWEQDGVKHKTIRQFHQKDGKVKCAKGKESWIAYRLKESVSAQGKWVLGVEGESCVEVARMLRIVAITWQGSSWSLEAIANSLTQLKEAGVKGLVYWPDKDSAGEKKADTVKKAGLRADFPVIVLNPDEVWDEMPEKGDIADWVASLEMSEEDRVSKIEEVANQESQKAEWEVNEEISSEIPSSFSPKSEYTQSVLNTLYGDEHWICVDNKLYRWTGTYYEHSPDVVEKKRIRDFLNAYPVYNGKKESITYPYAKPSSVENALKWVKISYGMNPKLVNPAGLNCTNGVLRINWLGSTPSWQLIDHHPSQYYLYEPLATYNPSADSTMCDRLLEALEPEQRTVFLRTIGASLDLATVRKYKGRMVKGLLLKGHGNNGKDTLREVVRMMYGMTGVTSCTLSDFKQYDEGRKFPLSRLEKSRVNWSSENATFTKLDSIQSLKAAITGDTLSKEGKGVDEEEFDPQSIFLFNCNDVPRMVGAMEAIASRYGVLSFGKTFKENADPTKGELEANPRFKYDPEFLKSEVIPAFLNRVLNELTNLMAKGIDYSCTQAAIEEIQAQNSHLFQFCQDTGLQYVSGGSVTAGEIWERLQPWYIEQGTLVYEETANGKQKALWIDQVQKSDKNVKGMNQIVQRFMELFPKAKRGKNHANQIVLRGIGFAEGSCLNGSNVDGERSTANYAEGSELSAIGRYLNPLNPDGEKDTEMRALGNEASEGSFLNPEENQTKNEVTKTKQESDKSVEKASENTRDEKSGLTALSASEASQRQNSSESDCLQTGLELAMAESEKGQNEMISDEGIEALATAVGWDAEMLMADLMVKYDTEAFTEGAPAAIAQLNPTQKLDLTNRLKAVEKQQSLRGNKRWG